MTAKMSRSVSLLLMFGGAGLWLLAPETWSGLALILLGILIEVIGFQLEKKQNHARKQ